MAWVMGTSPRRVCGYGPLVGRSAPEQNTIIAVMRASDRDITVRLIEHDMESALAFADRITLLHYGEGILAGTRKEVVEDRRTRDIYLGN